MKDDLVSEIAAAFGGHAALAAAAEVGVSAVSLWKRRGIPDGRKWLIQARAKERGITLPARFYEATATETGKAA